MAIKNKRKQKEKKKEEKKKKNKESSGGSVKLIAYKPRHGLRMRCDACGWIFRGGGYESKAHRDQVERDQKKLHDKSHKSIRRVEAAVTPSVESPVPKTIMRGMGIRTRTATTTTTTTTTTPNDDNLVIEKDTHAIELPHAFQQQTTRQTTTSTTYADVTGGTISSANFTASTPYLIIVTAQFDTGPTSTADLCYLRVAKGPTFFENSESAVEMVLAGGRGNYTWWSYQNMVTGDDIRLQMRSSTTGVEVGVDQVCVSVFRMTPDLALGTDFAASNKTVIESLSQDTDSVTANNASVTITPTTSGHRWLILSKARYGPGILGTFAMQSRIQRSGEVLNETTMMQQEGEDGVLDSMILCGARVDTLSAQSNTYQEISTCKLTATTGGPASGVRRNSGIFIMDLDKFKDVAFSQEDGPQETPNSSITDYAELIQSTSITPTQVGDVFCMGHVTIDWGGSNRQGRIRMQVDNTDQPATQTSDAYAFDQYDTADRQPICIHTIENLSVAAHTIDLDGSHVVDPTGLTSGTYTRTIVAFSLEMSSSNILAIRNDSVGISETNIELVATGALKVRNENNVGISETAQVILSSTGDIITPENLQLRYSGGTTNTIAALSLGGDMSLVAESVAGGFTEEGFISTGFVTTTSIGSGIILSPDFLPDDFVASDFRTEEENVIPPDSEDSSVIDTRLLDDVSQAEAISGDIGDYRCFYLYNTHTTLTMQGLKIWIPLNTPAADEVEIGLGTSDINVAEQEIDDEDDPPVGVTFTATGGEESALTIASLPAESYKAIWIKRTVPAGTPNPFKDNYYHFQVKLYSDHT